MAKYLGFLFVVFTLVGNAFAIYPPQVIRHFALHGRTTPIPLTTLFTRYFHQPVPHLIILDSEFYRPLCGNGREC